jgi:hypothetical protein
MRPRVVLAVWLAALLGAALLAFPPARRALAGVAGHAAASAAPSAGASAGPPASTGSGSVDSPASAAPAAPVAPAPGAAGQPALRVPAGGIKLPSGLNQVGWALLDRSTGRLLGGSANAATATNYTESMIKPWIAADYLSRTIAAGGEPSQYDLSQLRSMIIHSDNTIASHYYDFGGQDAVVDRLNQVCGLRTTIALSGWWSYTAMTPDDAVRYGECLADGRAAGAYTDDLLAWMREVTGSVTDQQADATTGGGRWGIIDALPPALAAETAIKNGWEPETSGHEWHVNCLAILPDQVLSVMVRYPWTSPDGGWRDADNLATGADACRSVAAQLLSPQPQ